jgi:hypothetical protein
MDDSGTLVVIWLLAGAGVGAAIGQGKGRAGEGAVLGALLGPIGWILAAIALNYPRKCPACFGGVPEAAAVCQHCGRELPPAPPESAPQYGYGYEWRNKAPVMQSEGGRFLGVRSPQGQAESREGTVKFNCPACDQSIEAPEDAVGQEVNCPTCQRTFTVPASNPTRPQHRFRFLAVLGVLVIFTGSILLGRSLGRRPVSQPGKPKQQVEGAFGFKLGEPLPQGIQVTTNDSGERAYSNFEFANAPPFDYIKVSVLNDRRVFEILLIGDLSNFTYDQAMRERDMVDALQEKYGLLSKSSEDWEFGSREKRVELYSSRKDHKMSLTYMDYTLLDQALREEKANRNRAIQEDKANRKSAAGKF